MNVRHVPVLTLALLAVGLARVASAQPLPPDDAAALLAKHKAFVGWQLGDGTFKTLKVAGTVTHTDRAGKQTVLDRFVDLRSGLLDRRNDVESDSGFEYDTGFNGKLFWYSDENGMTVPLIGDERKRVLVESAILNEAPTTMPGAERPAPTNGSRPSTVIRESMPDGYAFDVYEDRETGAFLRVVINPDDHPTTLVIDRYVSVGRGQRAIGAWHDAVSGDVTAFEYSPNVRIDAPDLDPPAAQATWTWGSGQPFNLKATESGLVVDAVVHGVRGHFLIASTSTKIVLTDDFAARANLHALAGRPRLTSVDTFTFDDGAVLAHVVAALTYSDPLGRDDIDGVLGFDFFARAVVDLDLDKGHITIFDPNKSSVNPDSSVVPLDLAHGVPKIRVMVNHQFPLDALIDTTGGDAIALPDALSGKVAVHQPPGTTDPAAPSQCGLLDSLSIGIVKYEAQPTCFAKIDSTTATIGYEFLRQLNVTFDYPDAAIALVPRKLS